MTALPQSTRRNLSLLKLAEELGNVSKVCVEGRIMGYHRDTFYEIKRAFQVGGVRPPSVLGEFQGKAEPTRGAFNISFMAGSCYERAHADLEILRAARVLIEQWR